MKFLRNRNLDPNMVEMVVWAATATACVVCNISDLVDHWTMVVLLALFVVSLNCFFASLMFPRIGGTTIFPTYDWIRRSWENATQPGHYTQPHSGGSTKIVRDIFFDFREIYDQNGVLLGHEQDIWSDGHWTFTPVDSSSPQRMPMIAYWRTKR